MARRLRNVAALIAVSCLFPCLAAASDHADLPLADGAPRPDLNWTDLHVFTVPGDGRQQLVLAMGVDAAVPAFPVSYLFPTDAKFRFLIDNEPEGADLDPNAIRDVVEDITFDVTFHTATDETGALHSVATVTVHGLRTRELENPRWLAVFAGARDDPFIRGPRQGRNVAAVVLQLPLKKVLAKGGPLHIWGTTERPPWDGRQIELDGRALNSMWSTEFNQQHPSRQFEPSVVTFDTALPARFPNGRALTDDVVDLVPELGLRGVDLRNTEGCGNVEDGTYVNCITSNESGFGATFPYLQPPH